MKKIMALVVISALLLSLVGCTGGDSSSKPSTGSESKPTASQAPSKDAAANHEPYSIEIYTFGTASTTYVMGVGLAELINKHSKWLKATALASESQNANANVLINQKPKTAIGYVVLPVLYNGYKPFTKPNQDLQAIAAQTQTSNAYMTLNPNIKTLADLNGKKVMLGPAGGYIRHDFPKLMFERIGVKPVFSYGGIPDSVDALINGQVDAILGGGTAVSPEMDKWSFSAYTELLTRFKVNFVSIDADGMKYAMEKLNFPAMPGPTVIPAGKYHESYQKELTVMTSTAGWVCNKEMPSDVINEILTIMFEHANEFGNFHESGKWLTPANIAKVDCPEWINETAKKFYIDRGVWPGSK